MHGSESKTLPHVHVIAEAGTNHGGDPAIARQLIEIAVDAGADSVKFQIIYPEGLYLPRFFENGAYVDNEVFAIRRAAMLDDDDYLQLADHARTRSVPLSASVFDQRGLRLLDSLDPPYIKIASCDLNHHELLRQAAELGRRLIVSTGMSTLSEIERAVGVIQAAGSGDLVLMHCVSRYPCELRDTNLEFLRTLRSAFGTEVGFSDHTQSSVAAGIAISMGATWIEKHFTYDRTADGFDHSYAMEPEAFTGFVQDVRSASMACYGATAIGKLTEGEVEVQARARRGLFAARDIQPGEKIGRSDLLIVRPTAPYSPEQLDCVVGRQCRRPIRQFQPIAPADLTDS